MFEAQFAGLEDDEVLVDGLQEGVGEAGVSVEDGSAEEEHVEELDEGAGGELVEEGLLVEAAGMEVRVAEGGAEAGVGEALLRVDERGFHGAVTVVLFDPVGDALGEGEVVERLVEGVDGAGDFQDFVDGAGVADALRADETDVEGAELGMLQPGVEEEVPAAETEGGDGRGCGLDDRLHLGDEGGRGALVGVEDEEPGVGEREGEAEVALGGVVVKGALVDVGPGGLSDGDGRVSGV